MLQVLIKVSLNEPFPSNEKCIIKLIIFKLVLTRGLAHLAHKQLPAPCDVFLPLEWSKLLFAGQTYESIALGRFCTLPTTARAPKPFPCESTKHGFPSPNIIPLTEESA